jgi:hypothetical protein
MQMAFVFFLRSKRYQQTLGQLPQGLPTMGR